MTTYHLGKIDTLLSSAAREMKLEHLIDLLKASLRVVDRLGDSIPTSPASEAVDRLDELRDKLARQVRLHNDCQQLELALSQIKSREPDEYPEIVRQWKQLDRLVVRILPDWLPGTPESAEELKTWSGKVAASVGSNDEAGVRESFPVFASVIESGFYRVDWDLKRLSEDVQVQVRAAESLMNPYESGSLH